MKTINAVLFLFVLMSLADPVPPLLAYWVEDGAPVSTAQGVQAVFQVISTDSGGSILVWGDFSSSSGKIYVQRLDASGTVQWTTGGIPVDAQGGNQSGPRIASDGAGGVIVAWQEWVSEWDIYAQRIDADGNILWSPGGVPLCSETSIQVDCEIIADGAGGAIVAWRDYRTGDIDVYAQRVNGAGSVLWGVGGVPVCLETIEQWNVQLTTDQAGGAIVVWRDLRTGVSDIYAQRLDSLGRPLWDPNGQQLCTDTGDQTDPRIISDGVGGAIVIWSDPRSGESDIYGQRVDDQGRPLWTPEGEPLCTESGDQFQARITADGLGGGIVSWSDFRNGNTDVYAQRVDPLGRASWATDGVPLCTSNGDQDFPDIVSDGTHGAIVTWRDRFVAAGIQAQRINSLGATLWDTNGVTLCAAQGWQNFPRIASDGANGAIVAWTDERIDSVNDDVYAQQIDSLGRVGRVLPDIHSVGDVPGDQGGLVNLAWDASLVDYRMGVVTEYTVWRALATPAALSMLANGSDETTIRATTLNGDIFYWQLVSSLAPYRLQGYSELVPTLFDSTAVAGDYHYFQVIAHTNDPAVFYISEPDSGYSVDNLAPGALLGLMGQQVYVPEGLLMTWAPNTESDLSGYRVYRGSSPDFPIDAAHLLATVTDTTMTDGGWDQVLGFHYKVAAVDIHENIGPPALLLPDGVSGVDDPVPHATSSLAQNYPNPFNPSTRLSFEIDTPGHVLLKVYDTAGRVVTTLVDEHRGPGIHHVIWDGLDNKGRMASAGVYLYRLESGDFSDTKRMTLIK